MAETFNITLNMDKTKRQPAAIAARVGDVDSISVVAQLYNGTEPYTPVGTSAYFECVCPNGYAVRQTASVSGTTVSATLVPEVFQAPGVINDAYFRFENGVSTDPTYVESTESFVILVYSSVDDNVEAGDYIAEWRQSQGVLDEAADVAASALPTIKSAVNSVEQAASGAITDINEAKADVEAAAGDVMKPINDAIGEMNETVQGALNDFNTDAQAELSAFDTNASTKINQFETNASSKLSEYDSDVNAFISSAQSSVNTNIEELDDATQQAIDAMESALSDDPYGDLLQRISRDWKLTLRDMVTLSGTVDLNLMNVGTFALSPSGATISNAPVTGNTPFILFSGQYFETMKYQLALYPSAETQIYIRYQTGTGSGSNVVWGAWSSWSPISGGGSSITTPVSIANGGTGATTAEQARANLGITSGGRSGGMSIKLYDKADLNFVFPNTSSYTLISYYNGTIPFSGFVMNGTYEFTGSCVIFSMMLTRKMITNPGYPYLYLTSQTMDNSTATATFDSNHGFNLFGNMSTNSVSSLHPFPYIGSAGRDFWNCGYIIGRVHQSPPTRSSITLSSGTLCILPFSLRFDTDGWCKMLLNCQANHYLNDYLTIDSLIIPPINIGVGGSVIS